MDGDHQLVAIANMHELAYGITSENPAYGDVDNPRKSGYIAGGSSGGSAAAVAGVPTADVSFHCKRHVLVDWR